MDFFLGRAGGQKIQAHTVQGRENSDCTAFFFAFVVFFTLPFLFFKWDSHCFFWTVFLHEPLTTGMSLLLFFLGFGGVDINHPTRFIIRCSLIALPVSKGFGKNTQNLKGNKSWNRNDDDFPKRKHDGIRTWIRSWKWKWMMMKHLLFVRFHSQGCIVPNICQNAVLPINFWLRRLVVSLFFVQHPPWETEDCHKPCW